MKPRPPKVPALYVEGVDDISAIAALLLRHGIDTKQGQEHLWIREFGSDTDLLANLQDTIKTERTTPCGFILDIDIEVKNRWQAVADRLRFEGDPTTKLVDPIPGTCPSNGFISRVDGYPHSFGVWLMPDCQSDNQKLEHLITSLIPNNDPLWPFAQSATIDAKRIVEEYNNKLPHGAQAIKCFTNNDQIKAQIRAWLAWQKEPGLAFGAAINNHTLGHDSPVALALLDWMRRIYGFTYITP